MKKLLGACVATGILAVAATPAMATIDNGLDGNSELMLTLVDSTNSRSLVLGLGVHLSDVLPSVLDSGTGLSFDVTSQINAILGAGAQLGTLSYDVVAVDAQQTNGGSASNKNFCRAAAVTGAVGSAHFNTTNQGLRQAGERFASIATAAGSAGDGTAASASDPYYAIIPEWGSTVGATYPNASAFVGTALGFYYYASATTYPTGQTALNFPGSVVATRSAYAGQWMLASTGTGYSLTYSVSQTPQVPLPAAVWLLISGLTGLGVIGRRKQIAAA